MSFGVEEWSVLFFFFFPYSILEGQDFKSLLCLLNGHWFMYEFVCMRKALG